MDNINIKKAGLVFWFIFATISVVIVYLLISSVFSGISDSLNCMYIESIYTNAYIKEGSSYKEINISDIKNEEFNELYLYVKESYSTNPDGFIASLEFMAIEGTMEADAKIGKLQLDFYTISESSKLDLITDTIAKKDSISLDDLTKTKNYSIKTKQQEQNKYEAYREGDFTLSSGYAYMLHISSSENVTISNFKLAFIPKQ